MGRGAKRVSSLRNLCLPQSVSPDETDGLFFSFPGLTPDPKNGAACPEDV